MTRQQAKGAPVRTGAGRPRAAGPKRDWLRWGSVTLAGLGALDSAYLTWVKLAHLQPFCGGSNACDTVNTSIYSQVGGIPIAVLGLAAYLVLAALLLLEERASALATWGPVAVFGMALTGTLYSAYLTYVELYVLHAVCPYCVVSAVCIAGILALSVVRLARDQADGQDD